MNFDFGNFVAHQQSGETRIDYRRNSKDWFDLCLALIIGIVACVFVWLMYAHTHFNKPIFWIVGICFGFLAVVKLVDGFFRLIKPTRSVVVIQKDKRRLLIRDSAWKIFEVGFEEISTIVLKGKTVMTTVKYSTRYQIYMTIQIVTRDGRHLLLATINPIRIVTSAKETEIDEYEIGQGLAKFVAAETGRLYQWAGFERNTEGPASGKSNSRLL